MRTSAVRCHPGAGAGLDNGVFRVAGALEKAPSGCAPEFAGRTAFFRRGQAEDNSRSDTGPQPGHSMGIFPELDCLFKYF